MTAAPPPADHGPPSPAAMKLHATPYSSTPPAEPARPPQPPPRLLLLLLLSLFTVGSHYGKHSLSSLGPEIMAALDVRRLQFGILFSSQELPGIVLPVLGGLALTYVPHIPAALVLSALIFLSTLLCAIAVARASYPLLFAARFLFGLSDGALTTLQGALVAHCFRHRIGRSFGLTLLVSRLSSFAGLALPAFLSRRFTLNLSMSFSVLMCLPSLLATVLYAACAPRYPPDHRAYLPAHHLDHPHHTRLLNPRAPTATAAVPASTPRLLSVVRSLSWGFWLVCYLWVAVAGAVFSLLHFAPDAFSAHLGLSSAQSGLLSGSLVLFAGLASPAVGVLQDRFGRRGLLLAVSCAAIGAGILLCASGVESEAGRAVVVAGLALVAGGMAVAPVTLMSSIALCVDDFATAAALGLYKGTENAGLAVLHIVTGGLRDESGGYVQSFVLLAGLAFSGVFAAAALSRAAPVLRVPASEMVGEGCGDGGSGEEGSV